jgi:LysR family transcriptional regulator (chromosome initiation inhibitor)
MSLLSHNLQAFEAIARLSTVHAAAKELLITQTGVTQRIRALENELRVSLFIRSRAGMKLTTEAEALLRYCHHAKDLEGEALSHILGGGKDKGTHITLAGPTSVMSSRIAEQCLPLYAKWPHLFLHFLVTDAVNRLELAKSAKSNFVILAPQEVPREMDSKMLKPDRYLLVASVKWKGRRLSDILENEKLIDFDERDPTSINYFKKFKILQHFKNNRIFANNNEVLIKLFLHGVGYGTLTQEIAKPYLESGKLIALNNGAVLEDPLALAWYPRKEMPSYLKDLIQVVK